ncbi:MAG: RNA polymerase sigma factor [Eubacteriales bacterium]|nr:RNA polymerase sigma factor [Eubacteriales bacterium]
MTPAEIEILVETHMESVFQFCCFLTGNRADAEDLSQDTFLKAMELERKFHWNREERADRNYLIGIAVNLWKNQQRKMRRRQRIAPMEPLSEVLVHAKDKTDVEAQVLEQELTEMMQQMIALLPEKQRIVVHLFYASQMSMEEIAKILHIPKETVKSRLRLAKKRLRNNLEVYGYEI